MIKNVEPISSLEFNKGLVTRSDFLKGDINSSPNTMDVQWNFDASLHKRLGSSSMNSIILTQTGNFSSFLLDENGTLKGNLIAYWKMDEPSGSRMDSIGTNNLNEFGTVINSASGIRGGAANFASSDSQTLQTQDGTGTGSDLTFTNSNITLAFYTYFGGTGNSSTTFISNDAFSISGLNGSAGINFAVTHTSGTTSVTSQTNLTLNAWHSIICTISTGSYIGISIDGVTTTAPLVKVVTNNRSNTTFYLGVINTSPMIRIDEVGIWNRVLSATEQSDIYGGGTGNTYTTGTSQLNSWASFDFGASSFRNYMVAAGTGIMASSNLGVSFFTVATNRTQTYQYFERSKNVLIATSDAYDLPLYWAGSGGTFAATLSPNSAPAVKFSINYNGFLILLNNSARKRGFYYADENLQLTDPYNNNFDLPSSDDDEITAAFVLYKFLYISTRYRLFRLAFVGGNPDWSYLKVKDWGYVPRTVRIVSMQGGGQFALGMDWNHRLRLFDGFDDRFVSDNVENDNSLCDFAMNKISYAGSGLVISHAELNPITQEYRLNVAIGTQSSQTTHGLLLNVRNLAFYPYANQQWQTMCMAESNNQKHLMAVDRSGFVYILDSGNLDKGVTPVNDIYDSPPLFNKLPEMVSKGKQINFFFGLASCGTIFLQDRVDLSNKWSPMVPLSNIKGETQITGTENLIKVLRVANVPSTFNTWQFRLTSSANTANPWELDRLDFFQQGFGIGRGNNG